MSTSDDQSGAVDGAVRRRRSSSSNAQVAWSGSGASSSDDLYKTELCHAYESTGSCKYGLKCRFAHGRPELRPVARHPKYKTQQCKTFQESGHCPYGARCKFIHEDEPQSAPAAMDGAGGRLLAQLSPRMAASLDPGPPYSTSGSPSDSNSSSYHVSREVSPRTRDSPREVLMSPRDVVMGQMSPMSPYDSLSPRSPDPLDLQPRDVQDVKSSKKYSFWPGRRNSRGQQSFALGGGRQAHDIPPRRASGGEILIGQLPRSSRGSRRNSASEPPRRASGGELQIGIVPRRKEDRLPIFQNIVPKSDGK